MLEPTLYDVLVPLLNEKVDVVNTRSNNINKPLAMKVIDFERYGGVNIDRKLKK